MIKDAEIDFAIRVAIGNRQLKTARIIGEVGYKFGLEYDTIAERIYELVERGANECFGNVENWRHSELRLPVAELK